MEDKVETITEADMNERSICPDCIGCGRYDGKPCLYCQGSGRVLTYRARIMREQHRERLNAAAPALYEALRSMVALFPERPADDGSGKVGFKAKVTEAYDAAVAALALVTGTVDQEGDE